MKQITTILLLAAAAVACADVDRTGEARDVRYPDVEIIVHENTRHGYEIQEAAPLFAAHFATVHYAEYHLNYAEQRRLAVAVARAVAGYLGSTNDIRVVHWEQPEPAGTNLADRIGAFLQGGYVTDETIPAAEAD